MQPVRPDATTTDGDGVWSGDVDDCEVSASFTLPSVASLSLKPSVSSPLEDVDDEAYVEEAVIILSCKSSFGLFVLFIIPIIFRQTRSIALKAFVAH